MRSNHKISNVCGQFENFAVLSENCLNLRSILSKLRSNFIFENYIYLSTFPIRIDFSDMVRFSIRINFSDMVRYVSTFPIWFDFRYGSIFDMVRFSIRIDFSDMVRYVSTFPIWFDTYRLFRYGSIGSYRIE